MVEDRKPEPACQSGNFDVLHSLHSVPMAHEVLHCGFGYQEGLASKNGIGLHDDCLVWEVNSRFPKPRVIQSGQGDFSMPKRPPVLEIVSEVPVKREVVFQKQNVIGVCSQAPLQGAQRSLRLARAIIFSFSAVHLNMDRFRAPVCLNQVFERLPSEISSFRTRNHHGSDNRGTR